MHHQLDGLVTPSDPAVSPSGDRVAFVVNRIDTEGDRYVRSVWMASGSEAEAFTIGESDTSPRWSPDGGRLAFLRKVDDHPQLAVIPVDGGEATFLTDFPLGVAGEPVWSPDGTTLAVVGVTWEERWADLDPEERERRPRRIRRRDYRGDQLGWTHDRRRFIYLIDLSGGHEPRRLTTGDRDETGPAWTPDGTRVAYLSDTTERPGYAPGTGIHSVLVDGDENNTAGPRGIWGAVGYRPDGILHAVGSPGSDFPDLPMLWRFEPEPVCVSPGHDRAVFTFTAGAARLVFDGDRAIVSNVDSGSVGVVAIDGSGECEQLIEGRITATGFDFAGGTLAATVSTVDSPGHLVISTPGQSSTIEDFGGVRPEVVAPDHFLVQSPGGDLDVWVYLPEGDGLVPLLLNIHGGPAAQYGWLYFDEFQAYVAAGYGVVATNPRGSGGRDREFLRAVKGDGWGVVDVEDVDLAVAAALERHPRLDADRMGVMGGSYGGYLTAWIIAHQDRWRSAIVERALLSWPSFAGTSDIGGWFGEHYLGSEELARDRSPLRVADRITTPTLVLHSEADFRCPIEQAEQFFDLLVRNGVETEFVRFPGEGHELSRSGSPRHREERFEIVLDWLERTLR